MKKFMANILRTVFAVSALVALIPTNAMRFLMKDPNYHLGTKNKSWDFLIGLIVVLFGTVGLNTALEINFKLIYSHGLPFQEFMIYHFIGIVLLSIGLLAWGIVVYNIVKSSRKVIDAMWSVEL